MHKLVKKDFPDGDACPQCHQKLSMVYTPYNEIHARCNRCGWFGWRNIR